MQQVTIETINDRVSVDAFIPAAIQPLPGDVHARLHLRDGNLTVLGALESFGEQPMDTDEESPLYLEWQRVDAKLNAVMAMVGQLLQRDAALPPRYAVRFNAVGAVLPKALWPLGTSDGVLQLHLDALPGLPLRLAARLLGECNAEQVSVAFEGLGDVVTASLERMVFRHHRRFIAEMRQTAP